jgi:inner membrane transporter RhtA
MEPAFALVIGFLVLSQVPDALAVLGIGFVVAAGIGAERTGARSVPEEAVPAADRPDLDEAVSAGVA